MGAAKAIESSHIGDSLETGEGNMVGNYQPDRLWKCGENDKQ